DLAILAFEARSEPELLLAAVAPLPSAANDPLRQIVIIPSPRSADDPRCCDPRLFLELAARRVFWILALVEPTLRHLPPLADTLRSAVAIGTPADENLGVAIDEHHADAGPVRQVVGRGHE